LEGVEVGVLVGRDGAEEVTDVVEAGEVECCVGVEEGDGFVVSGWL